MDEDLKIVERFKNGQTEVFSDLVEKYSKPVLNLVYRISGNFDDVEDLTQEVFLRAYKGLNNFKGNSKFFTWLYRIAVNVALRAREKKSKISFVSIEEKKEKTGNIKFLVDKKSPDFKVEKEELQEVVRNSILSLPKDQKNIVILYRYHNLSYDEISQILELSIPAVKSRLYRARKSLKEKLAKYISNV